MHLKRYGDGLFKIVEIIRDGELQMISYEGGE
jgi:hypothetical protein